MDAPRDESALPPFADPPAEFREYERARVIVLPVPYEQTTTYLRGTASGPAAILRASAQVELYDEVLGAEPYRIGIHTLPPLEVSGPPESVLRRIADRLTALPGDCLPVLLGGEHTLTLGAARACLARHAGLGFLVLDAHDDLRDAYQGSRFNHACVSRRLSELGPVVQVGVRSVSPEGAAGAVRGVRTFFAHDLHRRGTPLGEVVAALPERVYLSVDVDVFDPAFCPGVGTPEPGGLDWYQVTDLIAAVASARRIVAFDVVEVRPLPGQSATEFLAAKLAYRTIGLAAQLRVRPVSGCSGQGGGA